MSSVATRAPAGSLPVRLSPAQRARLNHSSVELESFVDTHGGLVAGSRERFLALQRWYGSESAPSAISPAERQAARLARLIRAMPDGLTPDEQTAWIAAAEASL